MPHWLLVTAAAFLATTTFWGNFVAVHELEVLSEYIQIERTRLFDLNTLSHVVIPAALFAAMILHYPCLRTDAAGCGLAIVVPVLVGTLYSSLMRHGVVFTYGLRCRPASRQLYTRLVTATWTMLSGAAAVWVAAW